MFRGAVTSLAFGRGGAVLHVGCGPHYLCYDVASGTQLFDGQQLDHAVVHGLLPVGEWGRGQWPLRLHGPHGRPPLKASTAVVITVFRTLQARTP